MGEGERHVLLFHTLIDPHTHTYMYSSMCQLSNTHLIIVLSLHGLWPLFMSTIYM